MEANPRSPRDLFDGKEHYEIPAFQRPYVWNEEDQWAPLWDDLVTVAESHISGRESGQEVKLPQHLLGAVVYETKAPVTGDVTRHEVIDGQQRMTTLQLLLDAVQEVVDELGPANYSEALEDLILNKSKAFAGKRERFKLWPSQADREAFTRAMDPSGPVPEDHRIIEAHRFFQREARRWLIGKPDEDGVVPPGTEELRVEALCATLQDQIIVVAIDLTGHDDAQLIFETLNDRGTPLLKADLIKNWVFRKGESIGADVEGWSTTHWADFDGTWWREEVTQGRQSRSRVDIFLQYWLTMRMKDEVKTEAVFRTFAEYAEPLMGSPADADVLLMQLHKDAETYRGFAQLDHTTVHGRFYSRVIETMELAATTPVLLWLLSQNNGVGQTQLAIALEAIESWVIRRTLLRLTAKDVNRFMVAILKELDGVSPALAGETIRDFLAVQTADARYWPSDAEVIERLPAIRIYGNIRQGRVRVVLAAVEQHLRDQSHMYEAVELPEGLSIEHVMPRGWRTHWDTEPPMDPEQASRRDWLVNTLGNLTLVTRSLNSYLSNRPWTDGEAVGLKEGGEPGKGKRALLDQFSLLVLNKELTSRHIVEWSDDDIVARSRELAQGICAAWPRPPVQQDLSDEQR